MEYRDPVLHQFLALAWLLFNRRLLLETSRDDVPETLSKLRLQSTEIVQRVLAFAVELQRATPRRFCSTLRAICYDGKGGNGGGDGESRTRRISLLGGLKATGMVLVDADQVAETLLSREGPVGDGSSRETDVACENRGGIGGGGTAAAAAAAAAPGDESKDWGASRCWDRWILVDCRPSAATSSSDTQAAAALTKTASGVSWRRIDSAEWFGSETIAIVKLLEEFAEGTGREGRISGGAGVCGNRSRRRSSNGGALSAASPQSEHSVDTHMCFIGAGGEGEAAAGDAELRLARAASRSCLVTQVCVLEGGFWAFDEALRNRGAELGRRPASAGGDSAATGVTDGVDDLTTVSAEKKRQWVADEAIVCPNSVAESDAASWPNSVVTVGFGHGAEERARDEGGAVAEAVAAPAAERMASSTPISPPSTAKNPPVAEGFPLRGVRSSSNPVEGREVPSPPEPVKTPANSFKNAGTEKGGVIVPPRLIMTHAHSIDRKISRLASSNKVSEPFRVYAAKSTDEMGQALRSLPTAASKPLEVREGEWGYLCLRVSQ